jgi:hypothetical protein
VRAILAVRREASFWRRTVNEDTPRAYWTYLRVYPRGPHVTDARRRLAFLSAAFDPPANFQPNAFEGLPPPPPDEVFYEERPVYAFDEFGPPPAPPPVEYVYVEDDEWRYLPPPPPPVAVGVLANAQNARRSARRTRSRPAGTTTITRKRRACLDIISPPRDAEG